MVLLSDFRFMTEKWTVTLKNNLGQSNRVALYDHIIISNQRSRPKEKAAVGLLNDTQKIRSAGLKKSRTRTITQHIPLS